MITFFEKLKELRSFFEFEPIEYRHGMVYKLFYKNHIFYRVYVIQKTNWLGDFTNIFETEDKKVYENKVKDMMSNGVVFKN
jgi:hypothetical protein